VSLLRIGDKVVDRRKIDRTVTLILESRQQGMTQQEVADRLGVDRTFISRLEGLGEVRKGRRIALIGFPLGNRVELERVARSEGVDFVLLLTQQEREEFVDRRSGAQLLNDLLQLIAEVRCYDVVIMLGSDWRVEITRGLIDREVVPVIIGDSPITADIYYPPESLRDLIKSLRS